jgi:hypothetical protein
MLDPENELARLHFGQEDVGVPVFEANEEDLIVRQAIEMPDQAAPQVADVKVGSSTWDRDFVNLLESQEGTVDPSARLEILPFTDIDQIKVTFTEDVLIGLADLSIRGAAGTSYSIRDFQYNPESATAVWTLSQPLGADTISLRIRDAVGDLSRDRLDGDVNARPGGTFVHQFHVLPGDVTGDGLVDAADTLAAAGRALSLLGEPGYLFSDDLDGNGVVDAEDAMAVDQRIGTSLPGSVTPVLTLGDANADGRFDQRDIIQVLQSGKYLTGELATWSEGDWNRDGRFDQRDIIKVLQEGRYQAGGEIEGAVDELFEEMGQSDL